MSEDAVAGRRRAHVEAVRVEARGVGCPVGVHGSGISVVLVDQGVFEGDVEGVAGSYPNRGPGEPSIVAPRSETHVWAHVLDGPEDKNAAQTRALIRLRKVGPERACVAGRRCERQKK